MTLRSRAVTNFTIGDIRHRVIASIEIEDDGPGIPLELQDSVFYPLVTTRAEGTGLGLPAAQELVSRHGGLIEFESRPGRTVFFVRIPLEQAGPESMADSRLTVWVVDDDQSVRWVLEKALRQADIDPAVSSAPNTCSRRSTKARRTCSSPTYACRA